MDFRILGALEVLDEDRAVMLGGSKQRALLALLLIHANETLTTDRLIDELWGAHPPATAAKTVQMHVSRLRKALASDSGLVVTREGGYELRLEPEQLDSLQFGRLTAQGSSEVAADRPDAAVEVFERALALWRDTPLADLAYEPFAQNEIRRLEEMRVGTLEQLIEAKLLLGRHAEVIVQLEELVAAHPYRERMRAQLMLALYRSERQAEALQAYQDARRQMVEELGIEPGEGLRELERQILAQDPALAAPTRHAARDGSVPPELPTGVVTFMLTDIEDSSRLWDADAGGMAAALELHDELIARTVHAHAGRLLKTKGEGDSTMAAFPRASDAVAGAVALQEALGVTLWPDGLELRVRIALHTGEAQERAGDYFGPAINRAARLRSLREGGVTVMSQATAELVQERLPPEVEMVDLGIHALRGLSRPENVFELRPVGRPPLRGQREMRKTVTVLFSSIAVSAQGRELDLEVRERLFSRYLREMRAVLERHGGTIGTYPGDALMAVFGVPRLHEDDAVRAVRAAAEMRKALVASPDDAAGTAGVRVSARVGVGTGEVIAARPAAGQPLAAGEALNVARQLEEMAGANQILIDEETHRLVQGSVRAERRQSARCGDRFAALRVVEVLPHTSGRTPRLDSPLVGRDRELSAMSTVFATAVGDRTCHLVTLLGPAGVGKSRLVNEFVASLGDEARVLRGSCLPYGEGITYWPLAEVVRDMTSAQGAAEPSVSAIAAQVADEPKPDLIVAGIAEALGVGGSRGGTSEQSFWAVRRMFEALACRRPLVVVFDDLQWAEPTFLDLIDDVTDLARDAPIVVLCIARPELLEGRSGWSGGKLNATSIHLEPLDQNETLQLITNLLNRVTLPPETATRIAEVTDGNPLFAEELLYMLIDDGLLRHQDGEWTVLDELPELPVPPTIHALLAARLERLPQDEQALLAHASVEGVVFHRAALNQLTAREAVIQRNLTSLIRKDLICPDRALFPEDEAFRFRHVLIRDAAYRSLLKETRAELHANVADWLERSAGPRLTEFEEIVGYHLERAYRSLVELGPPTEQTKALAARAVKHLSSAGEHAFARGDMPAAVNLLSRATAILPSHDVRRLELLPDLAFALMETADFDQLLGIAREMDEAASETGNVGLRAHAIVLGLWIRLFTDPEGWAAEAEREAKRAIDTFAVIEDERGLARAWSLLGLVRMLNARLAPAEEAWSKAVEHAERAGNRREALEGLTWVSVTVWAGPTTAEEGIRRCREVLERAQGDRKAMSTALSAQAGLEASLGHFDDARELFLRARILLEEVALPVWKSGLTQVEGWALLLEDKPAAAEQELRRGYETLSAVGEVTFLSTVAGILAEAIYAQGRYEESELLTHVGEESAGTDDVYTHVLWRSVRAKCLARRGELIEALRVARESVTLVDSTDSLHLRWHTLMSHAEVLRIAGRIEDADAAVHEAIHAAEQKGNLVGVERARRGALPSARAAPAAPREK
jgi:class 3 adenylate cyclase/DNA-binding winged helix-turn-helix (wHTH) protein